MNTYKHKSSILVIISIGFLFITNGFSQERTAGELFEKALYLEEAQGDLQKAIELYQVILKQFPKDRETSAKAQLHIGLCYEKLGLTEAPKAYQKVLDDFPDQVDTAKVAQEKLSIIKRAKAFAEDGDSAFTLEAVWPKPKWGISGAPSPDGKYLSFVDWDTSDLAIREIKTGKTRLLTDLASHPERQESAYNSRWSPDSKQLAYCWESDTENYVDLRVIGIENSKFRVLHRGDYDSSWIAPFDWTPDGKHILAGLIEDKFKFVLYSSVDDSFQVIKEIDILERYNYPKGGFISSDGKYIVYDSKQNEESPNHDIYLLSSDGKITLSLAPHPGHDSVMGWSPDGKKVLFVSDRSGTNDLWMIPVESGKQIGEPFLLRMNIGSIKPLGITQDGSFFFNTAKGKAGYDIYTAPIDANEKGDSIVPEKMVLPYEGNNGSPVWSPDGKHLAYISRRGALNRPTLCIYSFDTGEIRTFQNKGAGLPRWCQDGRSLLVYVAGEGICKVDLQTGQFVPLLELQQELRVTSPNISVDNKYLYFVRFDRKKIITYVVSRELATKKEVELYRIPLYEHNTILSPDGQKLALICSENPYENKQKKHVLIIIPTAGGEAKEIYSFKQEGSWGLVDHAWSPDGRYIYFSRLSSTQSGNKSFNWDLCRVSVDGGNVEKLGLVMQRFRSLSMHPDGKQIVFASHSAGLNPAPEVWVMKNYLPVNTSQK